jgi:predicted DNA-binding transcriptional regulator AlpA
VDHQGYLTSTELLKIVRFSRATLYRYIKKGLPSHKVSEKLYGFKLEEVNNWIKEKCNKNSK